MNVDPLREGDRGQRVVELQLLLRMTGYDPGPVDGIFGKLTAAAASEAQEELLGPPRWPISVVLLQYLYRQPRLAIEAPRVSTPASEEALRLAVRRSYVEVVRPPGPDGTQVIGVPQMRNAVLVAMAQLAVEHGADGHGIHTFNVGNIQVSQKRYSILTGLPMVPFFWLTSVEGEGASAGKRAAAYPAFANLLEGCVAYWTFLREHCQEALARFEAGDPAGACHALKVGAWHFSGNEEQYRIDMVSGYHRLAIIGGLDPEPPEPG